MTTGLLIVFVAATLITYLGGHKDADGNLDPTGGKLVEVFSHLLTLTAGVWATLFKLR